MSCLSSFHVLVCSLDSSVAEPSHFSSAAAPNIFFLLRLEVKYLGSGSSYNRSALALNSDFDAKHLKNLNFNK